MTKQMLKSRSPLTTRQTSQSLSRFSADKHDDAERRILAALDLIAKDISDVGGVSSFGKVTVQLVLRISKLNSAYLEKKRPKVIALKARVIARIKEISSETPTAIDLIRTSFSKKAKSAQAEANAIRNQFAIAELQYAATLAQLDAANARIAELEALNDDLTQQVAKVIRIPHRGDRGSI